MQNTVTLKYQFFFSIIAILTITRSIADRAISDEFNQNIDLMNNNTSNWSVLGADTMDERAISILMGNGTLTVEPEIFSMNAWFEDEYGPLVYQNVTGNFAAVISLSVTQSANPNEPADLGFNAGGFVIRDASGTHNGDENWIMYNMGGQGQDGVSYAREMKKTVNSRSNLYLTEQIDTNEYLLACRIGDDFYYWADAINAWRQETFYNQFDVDGITTTTWRNSGDVTPEIVTPTVGNSSPMFFNHASMPQTVQLGIMGHSWQNGDNGVLASFDFIRFAENTPNDPSECIQEFNNINDLIFAHGFE